MGWLVRLVSISYDHFLPIFRSESHPFVDTMGRVFSVLVGQPRDPTYAADAKLVYQEIRKEANTATFSPKEKCH